jgi:hypothetical protein
MTLDDYRHILKRASVEVREINRHVKKRRVVVMEESTAATLFELLDIASRNLPEGELK